MLPTVKVLNPTGGWMLINESDFDGAIHQLWTGSQHPTAFLAFINSASSSQMADRLPGIGETSAHSIVAARNQLESGFTCLSELPKVRGVDWTGLADDFNQPD